ncbi:MAG: hypothetical protein WC554_05460 [Clostridia bacterium]|jgi:hypothetical protein
MANNIWSDVSSIAQRIEQDAYFVVRETATMQNLVTVFNDATGMNIRRSYAYNQLTAKAISDADDLVSDSFTPSADQTLTPSEIGLQVFVSDARAESELPESIITDASRELGLAASDLVESDLVALMASLTGGTVGTANSPITWGWVSAAIARARNANKNSKVPLAVVLHGYQYAVLAKAASIAGSSLAQAPNYTDEITYNGFVGKFEGVPIYQVFAAPDATTDFNGGVFPRNALALDWRRPIRIEMERNASRRGWEINMSAVYAKGVWRPTLGVSLIADATAPES